VQVVRQQRGQRPAAGLRPEQRGTTEPARRRALFVLDVSDILTPETRSTSQEKVERGIEVFRRAAATGAFRDQTIEFIGAAAGALANTTMDMMMRDPDDAAKLCDAGFEALWNMLH
jgi:hypothetical protein